VSDTSARVARETTCPDQIVWVKLLTRAVAQTCETNRPQAGNALAQLAHPAPNSRHALAALRSNAQRGASQTGPAKMSTTLEIYTISVPQAQRKAVENLAHLYRRVKVPFNGN